MGRDHEYYSDQCAECRWAEWRGGCLNKTTADDGSDLDAANTGKCTHFEAGEPQGPQPDAGAILMATLPKERLDAVLAKLAAAEKRAADAEAALKQAQDDALVLAADCINVVEAEYNVHVFLGARRFSAPEIEALTRLARRTNTSERIGPALRRVLAAVAPKETS